MANLIPITITLSEILIVILALAGLGVMVFGKKMKPGTRVMVGWITGVGVILMILAVAFSNALPDSLNFLNEPVLHKSAVVNFMNQSYNITYSINPGTSGTTTTSGVNSCGQNPTITPLFVDQLTGLSVTSGVINVKDKATGNLLGPLSVSSGVMTPSLANGQVITPIVNASGYLTEIQNDYQPGCGSQNIQGSIYAFNNVSLTVYTNAGTGTFPASNANTTNESSTTSQLNNKIHLVGNAFKSTGKMYVVYEVSNVTSVASASLVAPPGSAISITPISAVPNCYSNKNTGTPYKMAWEVASLIGAQVVDLNLNTVSLNGAKISGVAWLTIASEQDGIDSLTGAYLTSGICDSNNRYFGTYGTFSTNGAPTSASTLGGTTSQTQLWNII